MASPEPPELAPRAMQAREVISASYNLRVRDLREHVDKELDEIKNEILNITSKQTKQIAKQVDQLANLREYIFMFKTSQRSRSQLQLYRRERRREQECQERR